MRWERLFDDLEARLAAEQRAELAAEVAERVVAERSAVAMSARLAAHRGGELVLVLEGGLRIRGTLRSVAADGVLLDMDGGEALIPEHAIVVAESLARRVAARGVVESRLRLTSMLRSLAEQRARVVVETGAGTAAGALVGVGADHVDLEGDGPVRTVALAAVRILRAAPERPF
ncbi:hypothetical protein QQX10_13010 [Demequina sp. SYSU T00039]|uniref:Fis family transcriptional regulator n=1 Tax=Demequina lignilytica TaxID=3051663 RepID=A0AAW7M516_9MICO|nr:MULTISPECIES: hypothetical protein [unclassified Demequina]MDN4478287.1 hypothetical protein [Demequina sp. SYSU T00039-1]MDN4489087.1 hypothetical protein [Demequina sp. SYSU T00039]